MHLSARITWILMCFSLIDYSLSEVKNKKCESQEVNLIPEEIEISEEKIDFLKYKNSEIKERRDSVDKKANTLLTLTAILLSLSSTITGITPVKSVGIWAIPPIILLFFTIFLLTVYFGIKRNMTVDYNYLSTGSKLELCNGMLQSQHYNECVTNFMVDLYRSALRYFTTVLLYIMILGICNIWIATEASRNGTPQIPKQTNIDSQKLIDKSKPKDSGQSP